MIEFTEIIDQEGFTIRVPLVNNKPNGLGVSFFTYEKYEDKIRFEVPIVDGLKHGCQTNYSLFGGIKSTTEYINGIKHGKYTVYHRAKTPLLNPFMIFNYVDGVIQGKVSVYFNNHIALKLKEEYECVDGKIEGTKYTYYENGYLASLLKFKSNLLEGTSYYYNDKGMITESLTYKNGVCIIKNKYDSMGVLQHHFVFYQLTQDVFIGFDSIKKYYFYKENFFKQGEFFNFLNRDESIMYDTLIND